MGATTNQPHNQASNNPSLLFYGPVWFWSERLRLVVLFANHECGIPIKAVSLTCKSSGSIIGELLGIMVIRGFKELHKPSGRSDPKSCLLSMLLVVGHLFFLPLSFRWLSSFKRVLRCLRTAPSAGRYACALTMAFGNCWSLSNMVVTEHHRHYPSDLRRPWS